MMRRLMLFLEAPVTVPSLSRLEVTEGSGQPFPGAEYPIDWKQQFLLEGYSPTDEDDDALMAELFAWLRTLGGDIALVDSGWVELYVRKGGRVAVLSDYKALAA